MAAYLFDCFDAILGVSVILLIYAKVAGLSLFAPRASQRSLQFIPLPVPVPVRDRP
jgi:hypothetical protein